MSRAKVFESRVVPTSDVIHWAPTSSAYHFLGSMLSSASARYPIFVAQRVFAQLASSPAADQGKFEAGLLRGALCECPHTDVRFVSVERLERVINLAHAADPEEAADRLVGALRDRATARPDGWVGWYRQQSAVDARLADVDVAVDLKLGAPLWHALLVSGTDGARTGAFYAIDRLAPWSYEIPFFEVVDPRIIRLQGADVTAVEWPRYGPSHPVQVIAADLLEHLLTQPNTPPSSLAAVVQPLKRWLGDGRPTPRRGRDPR